MTSKVLQHAVGKVITAATLISSGALIGERFTYFSRGGSDSGTMRKGGFELDGRAGVCHSVSALEKAVVGKAPSRASNHITIEALDNMALSTLVSHIADQRAAAASDGDQQQPPSSASSEMHLPAAAPPQPLSPSAVATLSAVTSKVLQYAGNKAITAATLISSGALIGKRFTYLNSGGGSDPLSGNFQKGGFELDGRAGVCHGVSALEKAVVGKASSHRTSNHITIEALDSMALSTLVSHIAAQRAAAASDGDQQQPPSSATPPETEATAAEAIVAEAEQPALPAPAPASALLAPAANMAVVPGTVPAPAALPAPAPSAVGMHAPPKVSARASACSTRATRRQDTTLLY